MTAANANALTLEERVNRALHRLTLVERFCRLASANEDGDNQVDFGAEAEGDFWDGLLDLVERTREELDPIRHAPANVANWRRLGRLGAGGR